MDLTNELQVYKQKEHGWEKEKAELLTQVEENESLKSKLQYSKTQNLINTNEASSSKVAPERAEVTSETLKVPDPWSQAQKTKVHKHASQHSPSSSTSESSFASVHETWWSFDDTTENVHSKSINIDHNIPDTTDSTSWGKRKHRQPTPYNPETTKLSSWQWFLHFNMLIDYNKWSKEDARVE